MARPREFDNDVVLDRAMRVFWQRGYGGTSLHDLEVGTGIGRTSIYGAFGDKEGLFLAVVDHYDAHYSAQLRDALRGGGTTWDGVQRYFARLLAAFANPDLPLGCLVTNVAVEGDQGATKLGRRIAASIALAEDAFYEVLRAGQCRGEISAGLDARALSRYFVASTHGLSVLAKASPQPSALRDVVRTLLAAVRPMLDPDAAHAGGELALAGQLGR